MTHDDHPAQPKTAIERLARPFQIFARYKASGAIVLLLSALLALGWANSPWRETYAAILETPVSVGVSSFEVNKPLVLWINDGLMALFFFVVGLEIKREILAGELSTRRKAMLPIAGAVGGMVVPALVFALFNATGEGSHGWAIPMATDIAFALGVLALLGDRVPLSLKIFLTALAIVDDLGAILVIAVFYTEHIAPLSLAVGGVLFGLSILMNVLGVRSALVYFALGTLVWLAFLKSGVHATMAGVLMALTIPANTRLDGEPFVERISALLEQLKRAGTPSGGGLLSVEQQNVLQHMGHSVHDAAAPLQELEHALMPAVTFVVMPVFAFANAGVTVSGGLVDSITHPVCLGIVCGLFFGKQLGIVSFAWLAVRSGLAAPLQGTTWRQLHAVSVLGGVGFTMSLFIGGLAYTKPELVNISKVGILLASVLSASVGLVLLRAATPPASSPKPIGQPEVGH